MFPFIEPLLLLHAGFHRRAEGRAACSRSPDQAAHCHWQHSQRAEAQGTQRFAVLCEMGVKSQLLPRLMTKQKLSFVCMLLRLDYADRSLSSAKGPPSCWSALDSCQNDGLLAWTTHPVCMEAHFKQAYQGYLWDLLEDLSCTMQDELVRVGMSEMLIGRCLHYLQQQGDVELVRGRKMIHRIR